MRLPIKRVEDIVVVRRGSKFTLAALSEGYYYLVCPNPKNPRFKRKVKALDISSWGETFAVVNEKVIAIVKYDGPLCNAVTRANAIGATSVGSDPDGSYVLSGPYGTSFHAPDGSVRLRVDEFGGDGWGKVPCTVWNSPEGNLFICVNRENFVNKVLVFDPSDKEAKVIKIPLEGKGLWSIILHEPFTELEPVILFINSLGDNTAIYKVRMKDILEGKPKPFAEAKLPVKLPVSRFFRAREAANGALVLPTEEGVGVLRISPAREWAAKGIAAAFKLIYPARKVLSVSPSFCKMAAIGTEEGLEIACLHTDFSADKWKWRAAQNEPGKMLERLKVKGVVIKR